MQIISTLSCSTQIPTVVWRRRQGSSTWAILFADENIWYYPAANDQGQCWQLWHQSVSRRPMSVAWGLTSRGRIASIHVMLTAREYGPIYLARRSVRSEKGIAWFRMVQNLLQNDNKYYVYGCNWILLLVLHGGNHVVVSWRRNHFEGDWTDSTRKAPHRTFIL